MLSELFVFRIVTRTKIRRMTHIFSVKSYVKNAEWICANTNLDLITLDTFIVYCFKMLQRSFADRFHNDLMAKIKLALPR